MDEHEHDDLERYRGTCERALAWHGNRSAWPRSRPQSAAGGTHSTRVVELTVGDATLGSAPHEVAGIVEQLVSKE